MSQTGLVFDDDMGHSTLDLSFKHASATLDLIGSIGWNGCGKAPSLLLRQLIHRVGRERCTQSVRVVAGGSGQWAVMQATADRLADPNLPTSPKLFQPLQYSPILLLPLLLSAHGVLFGFYFLGHSTG